MFLFWKFVLVHYTQVWLQTYSVSRFCFVYSILNNYLQYAALSTRRNIQSSNPKLEAVFILCRVENLNSASVRQNSGFSLSAKKVVVRKRQQNRSSAIEMIYFLFFSFVCFSVLFNGLWRIRLQCYS